MVMMISTLRSTVFAFRGGGGARRIVTMGLKSGIVGLPNVGKSTLFNALTGDVNAEAANYPFCTIEPNVGVVSVPDARLRQLSELSESEKTVNTALEFVDIAGLVKGASKGEGLGNQFLANVRECDAIVHVVRCFADEDIIHVDGSVDPLRDIEVIELELALSDLSQIEKRLTKIKKERKSAPEEGEALEKLRATLDEGCQARFVELSERELELVSGLNLLTLKPAIFACNVNDEDLAEGNEYSKKVQAFAEERGRGERSVLVSAQVEAELVQLPPEDREDFLESLGVSQDDTGLRVLVKETYAALGLITYYTAGPQESRAWTIKRGWTAPKAAGVIHGDFERGFIRAETIAYDDLLEAGDNKKAKDAGLLRSEGKDYVVQDGDVMLFRFNV